MRKPPQASLLNLTGTSDPASAKDALIIGGSDLCRIALWQWIFTRLEIRRNRPKNEIGNYLGKILDAEKATGKPIRLVRMRVAAKAVRLLFKELVKAKT